MELSDEKEFRYFLMTTITMVLIIVAIKILTELSGVV